MGGCGPDLDVDDSEFTRSPCVSVQVKRASTTWSVCSCSSSDAYFSESHLSRAP